MPQLLRPPGLLGVKLAALALVCATLALLIYGLTWVPAGGAQVDAMNAQPVPFSSQATLIGFPDGEHGTTPALIVPSKQGQL